jgi:hypothetical protein
VIPHSRDRTCGVEVDGRHRQQILCKEKKKNIFITFILLS